MRLKPSVDWQTFSRDQVLALRPTDARTGRPVVAEELKAEYAANTFDDDIFFQQRITAMCQDLFQRLCAHGGPEQKVIIFCTRDAHADRVAMQMQRLYAAWCKDTGVLGQSVIITDAGIAAAAHREGADATRKYLQRRVNGRKADAPADRERDRRIEKRLRDFEKVPYTRGSW